MLEVADRLIASVGQDTMDSFFWCLTHPRPMRLILHTIFAILYMFVHSFIMLLQGIGKYFEKKKNFYHSIKESKNYNIYNMRKH